MLKALIYVENKEDPVMKISLLELTRIKNSYLSQIVLRYARLHKRLLINFEKLRTLGWPMFRNQRGNFEMNKTIDLDFSFQCYAKTKPFTELSFSVNLCDGCSDDSVSIIFTDEESFTVTSALKSSL